MKGMKGMMKQLQQMQQKMVEMQEQVAAEEVTGSAGGGMVQVTATGNQQIVGVKIDPEILEEGDAAMLEDLVMVAVNDALKKAQELMQERMQSLTGGLGLPPGMV